MADRPYMCRDEGLFLPECDDCSQLEGRVKALEDCCETATEELADHEERISSAESDIDTLQDDLMSAKSDIQSNTDAIDSIERLPEVTSADDGKVLTVVDGKWGIEPSSLVGEAIVGQSTVGEEETESDIDELKERMLSAESNIASLEENKQNKLTAGAGIQIQNDVISTTGSGDEGKADYTRIDECNDIVSFQADAKGVPLKSLTATINPKQDLHGYDKPWVGGAGKNMLDTSSMSTAGQSGVTFSRASDGVITIGGKANTTVYRLIGSIQTENGVQYTITGTPSGGASGKCRMTVAGYGYDYGSGYTFTGDGNAHDISVDIYTGYPSSGTLTFKPMVRLASVSDATFEPYSNICPISGWDEVKTYVSPTTSTEDGTTYTTDLPETVYGGSLDVVNGVLTDKLNLINLDNTISCGLSSQTSDVVVFDASFNNNQWAAHSSAPNAISNRFSTSTPSGQAGRMVVTDQHLYFVIAKSELSSLDESGARAWLNDHSTQLVYELATPQTYQLTPKQVTTLLGTNNVWADSGEVCLEYEHTQGVPTLKARRTTYTTTESSEDTFALTDYTASDILFVYVNGLMLVEGDEYTIVGTNVVLTTPITQAGTVVHIVALQARL